MLQPNNCSSEAGSEEVGEPDSECKEQFTITRPTLELWIQFGLTESTADSETEVRYIQNSEHNWICDLQKTAVHTGNGSAELSGTQGTKHSSGGTERR